MLVKFVSNMMSCIQLVCGDIITWICSDVVQIQSLLGAIKPFCHALLWEINNMRGLISTARSCQTLASFQFNGIKKYRKKGINLKYELISTISSIIQTKLLYFNFYFKKLQSSTFTLTEPKLNSSSKNLIIVTTSVRTFRFLLSPISYLQVLQVFRL